MKYIELTKGKRAQVDNALYKQLLLMGSWCYSVRGYAVCHIRVGFRQYKVVTMHRSVMKLKGLKLGRKSVDHRNGDRLDNRGRNLRFASRADNARNSQRTSRNTSGYKGVSFYRERNLFEAYITLKGHKVNLGRYKTALEAARVYDKAARKHFGRFAKPNFARAA